MGRSRKWHKKRDITMKVFQKRIEGMQIRWADVIKKDPCVYCGRTNKPSKRTKEHVIPLSQGGKAGYDNVVGACGHCNTSRSSRPLLGWLIEAPKSVQELWKQQKSPFHRG